MEVEGNIVENVLETALFWPVLWLLGLRLCLTSVFQGSVTLECRADVCCFLFPSKRMIMLVFACDTAD